METESETGGEALARFWIHRETGRRLELVRYDVDAGVVELHRDGITFRGAPENLRRDYEPEAEAVLDEGDEDGD